MFKNLCAITLCALMAASAASGAIRVSNPETTDATAQTTILARLVSLANPGNVLNAACCMTCKKGKPCGDSCISRDKTCHKGPGCAC